MNKFGLTPHQTNHLIVLCKRHLSQGTVVVYGSRAKGNFTERSDIDLVIQDAGTTDRHLLAELHDQIDESNIPYLCDIHYFDEINNPQLRDHILRIGQVLCHISVDG